MKRLLLIAAICFVAMPVMAGDVMPITGTSGTMYHNATTGEITKSAPQGVRGDLGRPLWDFTMDLYAFWGGVAENQLAIDCGDVDYAVPVQGIGFTAFNNASSDCALYIPLYADENCGHDDDPPQDTRKWLGGFYIENIPGSVAEGHPPDEYWSWYWRSWLIEDPILLEGVDLDGDDLQDFGYGFWYLNQGGAGLMGPGLVGDPNTSPPPSAPGAENDFDLWADPNFQFDPNLLGNPPANVTFVGNYWFGPTSFAQFYFEMLAPACPNRGDANRYCSADIYGFDCVIDLSDLAALLANYGLTVGAGVLDGDVDPYDPIFPGDGDVDLGDLAEMLAQYGDNCNL